MYPIKTLEKHLSHMGDVITNIDTRCHYDLSVWVHLPVTGTYMRYLFGCLNVPKDAKPNFGSFDQNWPRLGAKIWLGNPLICPC